MIKITKKAIEENLIIRRLKKKNTGSIVIHYGLVKRHSNNKRVSSMEIEYKDKRLALEELNKICTTVKGNYPINDIMIIRRVGRIKVGEVILMVAISSERRIDAFKACRYTVDCLKKAKTIESEEEEEES